MISSDWLAPVTRVRGVIDWLLIAVDLVTITRLLSVTLAAVTRLLTVTIIMIRVAAVTVLLLMMTIRSLIWRHLAHIYFW